MHGGHIHAQAARRSPRCSHIRLPWSSHNERSGVLPATDDADDRLAGAPSAAAKKKHSTGILDVIVDLMEKYVEICRVEQQAYMHSVIACLGSSS